MLEVKSHQRHAGTWRRKPATISALLDEGAYRETVASAIVSNVIPLNEQSTDGGELGYRLGCELQVALLLIRRETPANGMLRVAMGMHCIDCVSGASPDGHERSSEEDVAWGGRDASS